MKIYIIVEAIGYGGFEYPQDHYFTDEQAAQDYCDKCNKSTGSKTDWFSVHEMTPIK